jgi:hypothetical protein
MLSHSHDHPHHGHDHHHGGGGGAHHHGGVPVPAAYRGVWRRERLVTPEATDGTSAVFWLQGHYLFADLRIPAQRPDFTGITELAQCSPGQLRWLARQEGFAGFLEVQGEYCEWHRQVDYQLAATRDLGRMAADGDRLTEYGVFADYREDWVREAGPEVPMAALRLLDEPEAGRWLGPPRGFLLVVGERFLFARDRRLTPARAPLSELLADPALRHHERAALLDCELSLGRIGSDGWRIERSTLPFREGADLLAAGGLEAVGGGYARQPLQDGERIWQVFEWSPGLVLG